MEEDAELIAGLQGHILYPIDGKAEPNKAIVEEHGIYAYPTFVIVNADGEVLSRWLGYGETAKWVEALSEVAADPVTLATRRTRHADSPNFADALALGKDGLSSRKHAEAMDFLSQAQTLDEAAAEEANVPLLIFRAAHYGVGTEEVSLEQALGVATSMLQSENLKPSYAIEICEKLVRAQDRLEEDELVTLLEMAHPAVVAAEEEKLQDRKQGVLIDYAILVEKDLDRALVLKRESMPEGWKTNPDDLNEFGWWCFQRKINLGEAAGLMRTAVELSTPGSDQANYLDTLAELVNLQGNPTEALELVRQALEMDPESEYLKGQMTRFEELIAAS